MSLRLAFLMFLSLVLTGCIGSESTPKKTQPNTSVTKKQSKSYEIQLTGDWIKGATVVDSNNQQATYKGKGVYAFSNEPKGTITLTGGTFEETGLANKMALRADASSKTLSPLSSLLHDKPHLKGKVLNALNNQDGSRNKNAQFRTSKIIYLMASNNLLNQFSSSLGNVKNYKDIVASARSASEQSPNADSINIALTMISLSFFDVANPSTIAKIDGIAPTVSIYPTNGSKIGSATNKKPSFTLTFSEAVKNTNNTNIILEKTGGIDIPLTITNSDNVYTITPNVDLEIGENYALTIKSGITDNSGNALTGKTINYTVAEIKRYVTVTGAGSKEGTSWANAYEGTKLQQAINDVAAGTGKGDVWVAKGVYKPTSTNDASVSFELKSGVKLYGGFAGTETSLEQRSTASNKTVLSGDLESNDSNLTADKITPSYRYIKGVNSSTIIKISNATDTGTLINGLYITGGKSVDANVAGGLNIVNSTISIENVHFIGNLNFGSGAAGSATKITKGAAISSTAQSNLSVKNSTFVDNGATYGSGIFHSGTTLNIDGASFSKNYAKYGGAISIANNQSVYTIKNSTFKANIASNSGGAIHSNGSTSNSTISNKIENVAFINNYAVYNGGAIYDIGSSNKLINISFSGNSSGEKGGAIYNASNSSPIITNSTFSYNTSFSTSPGTQGGAVYNDQSAPTFINTTFYNNRADNGGAMFTSGGPDKKPKFVNCLLWNNEKNADTPQYEQDGGENNIADIGNNSHIKANAVTDPKLIEKQNSANPINGVVHTYYELGTNLSYGLGVVNNQNIAIPNKDQIGNARPKNSVFKGSIQLINTNATATVSRPFIKTISVTPTGVVDLIFSENMDRDSINDQTVTLKNEKGNEVAIQITRNFINHKKYTIRPTVSLDPYWYTLTVKTGIKSATGNKSLNREYTNEFEVK